MFWQQLNLEDSLLNELVTKEDTTLDRVLDESDVIQECKTKNEKLLEFLSRVENMQQLIANVTSEPQNSEDEKTKYYKSYVCCELLSSDAGIITDTLANDTILLHQLWNFVKTSGEINPLLASFFSKVVQILLNRRPNVVLAFLKDHPSLIDNLVFHIDTSAIMDVIYRIVICFENSITRFKVCHWLRDVRLIEKLVSSIKDDASNDALCNTCHLLSDILKVCRDPQESFKGAKDALLIELESEHTIQCLLTAITSSKNKHLINHGIGILQTYLTKQTPSTMIPNMVELDRPTLISMVTFEKSVSENLESLQGLLDNSVTGEGLRVDRLQVVKLLTLLVQCNSLDINRELVRLNTLDKVWKLFIKNPYNNFLHTQVVSMIEFILYTKVDQEDDGILLKHVINDLALMRRIEEVWDENNSPRSSEAPRKRRVGFLGHVYRMAETVQDIVTARENKKYFVEWLEKQHDPNFWNTFYEETLKDQRDKNETPLGPDPRRYNHMDSDDDNDDKIGIGLKNFVNNPLFSWKPDEEEDLEFSFEPAASNNNFSQITYKPVVVPEWKDKNLDDCWEKNITFAEPEQASSMQVQEDSSSSEDEDVKEVAHDPWASTPQQEFSKMDTDVSWANFNDFEPDSTSAETREKPWESTPPDGSVLHSSPKTADKKTKYGAPGAEYTFDDIPTNGVMDEEGMVTDSPPSPGASEGREVVMMTESPTTWPTTQITS